MKQLTLEELKQMSGQPVWCPELKTYGIIKCEGVIWKDNPFLCGVQYDSDYGTAVNFEYDIQKRGLSCYSVVSEKETPKKPKLDRNREIKYVSVYICPTCEKRFTGHKMAKYCYHCGQKLDWEDGD